MTVQHNIFSVHNSLHRLDHIRQLADTGRLNDNPVRLILGQHIFQRRIKVSHQGAADTAGIHLIDLNTGLLQKSTVDTDLAKLIFNQNHFLSLKSFRDQLLDQCRLSGSEETGDNIYLCHVDHSFLSITFTKLQNFLKSLVKCEQVSIPERIFTGLLRLPAQKKQPVQSVCLFRCRI